MAFFYKNLSGVSQEQWEVQWVEWDEGPGMQEVKTKARERESQRMDCKPLWGPWLFLYDGQLLLKTLKMIPLLHSQESKHISERLKKEQGKGWREVRKTLSWQLNCCFAIFLLLLTFTQRKFNAKVFSMSWSTSFFFLYYNQVNLHVKSTGC